MKLPVRRSVGIAAVSVAALFATVAPASAVSPSHAFGSIHRTSCTERAFLTIHNNDGRDMVCYADAGSTPVAIYGVNWVESGNNVVTLQYQKDMNNPKLDTVTIQKQQAWNPGHVHKIISIEIH